MNNKSPLKFDSGILHWSILRIVCQFECGWIIQLFPSVFTFKEGT